MQDLDETDLEILRLLMEDARRPWAAIADAVGLSPPAVSDRVERLRERGIIRRFTLALDRSQLHDGVPVLIEFAVDPAGLEALREALLGAEAVEHVFTTAERDVVCFARVPDGDVPAWMDRTLGDAPVRDFAVTLLTGSEWTPSVGGAAFAPTCVECGNTVTSEGLTARIDDDVYQFCCPSCKARFEEEYERLKEGAAG